MKEEDGVETLTVGLLVLHPEPANATKAVTPRSLGKFAYVKTLFH